MNTIQQTARPNSDFERGSEVFTNKITLKLIGMLRLLLLSVLFSMPMTLATVRLKYGSEAYHQIFNYGRAAYWYDSVTTPISKDHSTYVIDHKAYLIKDSKAYDYFQRRYFSDRTFRDVVLFPTVTWSLFFLFLGYHYLKNRGAQAAEDDFVRGAKIVEPEELARMLKRSRAASDEFNIADVPIVNDTEVEHFRFSGDLGVGKSLAIIGLADQVRARDQRAIIYDVTGELVERYFHPEWGDVLLNPIDARSAFWNLWSEVRNPDIDYAMLAASLFPSHENVTDPFWREGPRLLFESVAMRLAQVGTKTNRAFYETISTIPLEQVVELVKGTGAAVAIDPHAEKQALGVRASVAAKTRIWQSLPDSKDGKEIFSIRNFIEEEGAGWLFITSRADQHDFLKPLISLWCDIAAKALLSLRPDHERRVWFFFDELPSLQMLPALSPLMNQGRKYGACVVIGFQNTAQLVDAYKSGAIALLSAPQTTLTLRTREPETAKWLAEALGKYEVNEVTESLSMGAHPMRDGVQLQKHRVERYVVMPSEIQNLPKREGYLQLQGYPIARVHIEIPHEIKSAEQFVPRLKEVV